MLINRVLEDACKNDVELRAVLGDSIGNPELMRKRVLLFFTLHIFLIRGYTEEGESQVKIKPISSLFSVAFSLVLVIFVLHYK